MSTGLDPLISGLATEEQAADDDRWFRAKVLDAMNSSRPRVAHDEAMARVTAELDARRKLRAVSSVE
jgi:hypothetical protein